MAATNLTPKEMEASLGEKLKALRLTKNLDQNTLAERAGVSVRALRNLEAGQGSTLKILVSILRALGRQSWLDTIAPVATINPLTLTREAQPRQRASRPRRIEGKIASKTGSTS
jgi:transcriptional regulator with XRE-family HTH domain